MVLEDSTSESESSPSSFSGDVPTSDIDPYAASNGHDNSSNFATRDSSYIRIIQLNAAPILINVNSIPKPVVGNASGPKYTASLGKAINDDVHGASEVLKRPLRQEEAEAIAFNFGKTIRIGTYGAPVGATIAALQVFRTRNKGFRFPGWTPMKEGGWFSPDVFGPFRGQLARIAWSTLRTSSYLAVGIVSGAMFFGTYGITLGLAGRMTDPRLKEYAEAVKARSRERRGQVKPQQQNEGEGARAGETYEMARQRRSVQRQVSSQGRREQADDMSPTGGAFQEDLDQVQTDGGLMDDNQVRSYENSRQQQQGKPAAGETNKKTRDASQQQSQRRRPSTPSEQARPSPGMSSWDRLRNDAMSGQQNDSSNSSGPRTNSGPRSPSSGSDSFSFSQGDEDRQLAKVEAQKDFDARMERERQGKNFDEGRGGDRKW